MTEEAPGGALLWRAPAKLNLYLRVLRRREDGFHEIDSVAVKVTLYDELVFARRDDGRVRLTCSCLDCGPAGENLVARAAAELAPAVGRGGADIALTKGIRPAAGLGGGSSDAAATLRALNQLWRGGLADRELAELAGRVGSDVPLFLNGPAVRVGGRGERVEAVRVHPFWAVLCLPEFACPTGRVYAACDELLAGGEARPGAPRLDGPPSRWRGGLFNDLQPAAARLCPQLAGISAALAEATGLPVHLTGSGSGLFVLTDDEAGAVKAVAAVPADLKGRCRVVSSNPW